MDRETLYRKFSETKQEKLRLEAALQGFFDEADFAKGNANYRRAYAQYLRMRIRPAMELLMKTGDLEKMAGLAKQGWFGERELEGFIRLALSLENRAALLWLLHYKNRNFGFHDREFEL